MRPVNIWVNGEIKIAEEVELIIISDDLESACTLYWSLKEKDITTGGVTTFG